MELETDTSAKAQKDEQDAFTAGFDGEAPKDQDELQVLEPAEKPQAKTEVTEQPDAKAPEPLSADEIEAFRSIAKDMPGLRDQLRKVEGRIGSATDTLTRLQEQRRTDGQPATMTALELKKTREAYPELADVIGPDIEATLKALRIAGPDPEEVRRSVKELLAEELKARDEAEEKRRTEEGREAVRDVHPDFDQVIASEEFWAWEKTQPQEIRDVIGKSGKPSAVSKVLTQFKQAKAAAVTKAADRSKRLESAITPEGERRPPGKHKPSDEEAMNAGFLEGFNS